MSLFIIRNDSKDLTVGENKLLNKIKNLYENEEKTAYLYVQPTISALVPDFILIDEIRGISILEVKDWSIDYIKSIDKKRVVLANREDDNPTFKTKQYLNQCKGIISTDDELCYLDEIIYANVVLTNISMEEINNKNIKEQLSNPAVNILTKNILEKLNIEDMFSKNKISLSEDEITQIRGLLFPEIKIVKEDKNKSLVSIHALDEEQENFARKLPYGHYMITGVPGSGKTQILIARAIHLIKENPTWKIQIVTYNLSLTNKIESILNEIAKDYSTSPILKNIEMGNITVNTFHSLAKKQSNARMPNNLSGSEKNKWFNETLINIALEKCKPTFDAILIDEYQDFQDDWIRICIKLCKTHKYKNKNNKEVEGINLLLAGDRLQSIYNPKVHSWNKLGINMQGRSKFLKTCYRTGKENAHVALKFLQQDKMLENEVNNFYKEKEEDKLVIENIQDEASAIDFIEGDYEEIINYINKLIRVDNYFYNDILIICQYKSKCEQIKSMLPSNIRYNCRFVKEADKEDMEACLLTSTYYSAKGLEAKVVILVDVDWFSKNMDINKEVMERKLLYVGMTRASEKLIIQASNFNKDTFARDIRDIERKEMKRVYHQ